jgi:L,D-transpeptidase-like protein
MTLLFKRPGFPLPAIAVITALGAGLASPADAQRRHEPKRDEFALSRPAGVPLMAVVALGEQRVTIYDAEGRILRAPVSTGQTGYETPAGIFSIIQKNREHYSNLYDDASMPFMQRITWSGIALHAGVLPGHPASHGCIRMPYRFAEDLFDLTKMGMRVVIVRDDIRPSEISHPALFKPGPIRSDLAQTASADPQSMRLGAPPADAAVARAQTWRSIAAAKAAAADAAAKTAEEVRRTAVRATAEAARFVKALRQAEAAKSRAEAQLRDVERMLETASSEAVKQKAEEMKSRALERLAEAEKQLEAVKVEGQPRIDAAAAAREEVKAAEAAKAAAQNEAKLAEAKTAPVSVFISRKMQRLYVRQAFQPIFESQVTIRDPEVPIGTAIFTAINYTNDGADVRWNVLSMYANATNPDPPPAHRPRRGSGRDAEPAAADVAAAKAALERITIPQDALERIGEVVSPGSSLIISDEALSRETGKGTDFIVVMSGEPQGALKIRRANPYSRYDMPYYRRSPYYERNPYSWW